MRRECPPDPVVGRKIVRDEHGLSNVEMAERKGGDSLFGAVGPALGSAGTATTLDRDCHHAFADAGAANRLIVVGVALRRLPLLALLPAKAGFVHLHGAGQQPVPILQPPGQGRGR